MCFMNCVSLTRQSAFRPCAHALSEFGNRKSSCHDPFAPHLRLIKLTTYSKRTSIAISKHISHDSGKLKNPAYPYPNTSDPLQSQQPILLANIGLPLSEQSKILVFTLWPSLTPCQLVHLARQGIFASFLHGDTRRMSRPSEKPAMM